MILLLITLICLLAGQGCGIDNAVKESFKAPMSLSFATMAYRSACGKWPHSLDEIIKFSSDCNEIPFDPNLIEAEKSVQFEELPDGKLKITSTDASSSFTVTLDAPSDGNAPPPELAHCCGNKK